MGRRRASCMDDRVLRLTQPAELLEVFTQPTCRRNSIALCELCIQISHILT